jgi:hypothetical protein
MNSIGVTCQAKLMKQSGATAEFASAMAANGTLRSSTEDCGMSASHPIAEVQSETIPAAASDCLTGTITV